MAAAPGLVRDTQPFCDARFSRQEVIRFVGIELDLAMAGRLEFKWLGRQRIYRTLNDTIMRANFQLTRGF